MKYNGNNKETKEAILKENQPFFTGKAVINVYVDNEHAHEVFYEPNKSEININDVFAMADVHKNLYINYHDVKTEVIFTANHSRM